MCCFSVKKKKKNPLLNQVEIPVLLLLGWEHRPAKWPLKKQPISARPLWPWGHNENHSAGLSHHGQELCRCLGHSAQPCLCVHVGMSCLHRKRKGGAGDWTYLRRWRVVCTTDRSGPPISLSQLGHGYKGHVRSFPVTNLPCWCLTPAVLCLMMLV